MNHGAASNWPQATPTTTASPAIKATDQGAPQVLTCAINSIMSTRQYNNTKLVTLQEPLTRVPRKFCSAINSIMRPASATPRLPHRSLSLVSRSCGGMDNRGCLLQAWFWLGAGELSQAAQCGSCCLISRSCACRCDCW